MKKTISMTYYSLCVRACVGAWACTLARIALLMQHAKRMRRIVMYGFSGSTTFSDNYRRISLIPKLRVIFRNMINFLR